jgi:hypothetical protein
MKFDQTQFFLLVILLFLVLLFISSPTFFFQDNMEKDVDFSCLEVPKQKEIVDETLYNRDKAIDISRDTSMSFYEYLKRLDESKLQEPFEIRTVEFWLQNKDIILSS